MRTLTSTEISKVAGGPLSIYEQLMEMYPFGEWVGNSFFPNGVPSTGEPNLPPVY